jgi:hypothetical protein
MKKYRTKLVVSLLTLLLTSSSLLHAQTKTVSSTVRTCNESCPSIRGGAIASKTFIDIVKKSKSKLALVPYADKAGAFGITGWTYGRSKAGPREQVADLPFNSACAPCVSIPESDTIGFWMLSRKQVMQLCKTLEKRKDIKAIVFAPRIKEVPGKGDTGTVRMVSWAVLPITESVDKLCGLNISFEFFQEDLLTGDANPCPPCNTKTGRIR